MTEQAIATIEERPTSLLEVIASAARDPNVDVVKLRALLDLKREVEADEAKREFSEAMNEVQKLVQPIAADASNPQTSSRYASYHALDKVLRPIYTAHGVEVSHTTEPCEKPDIVRVVTTVSHKAGHSRSHQIDMPADGKGARGGDVMTKTHAVASAVQYGRRYNLGNAFSIAITKDDDGNAAGGGFISEDQVIEIRDLLEKADGDEQKFLAIFKVETFEAILARDYKRAVKLCRERIAAIEVKK